MKGQFGTCKKIKCTHMGESECNFADCIYSSEEVITRVQREEDVEFMMLVMKMLASTAGVVLIAILLINVLIK